jgi:hypothetical protein
MKTYTLHRINLFFLLKYGFVMGLIVAFPLVSLSIIYLWGTAIEVITWLRDFQLSIPVPLLSDIEINGLALLQDLEIIVIIQDFASLTWTGIILRILVATLVAGILTSLVAWFSGVVYNLLSWLTGGMKLTLSEGTAQVQAASPQPQVAAKPQVVAQPAGPRLEVTAPVQRVIPITSQETLIGSSPECVIQLDGLQPRHALLSYEDGRYVLRDYSQGQTQVQGRLINGVNMVRDGFLIQIGPYSMIFRY